jgi:GntR family transcriptional regulator
MNQNLNRADARPLYKQLKDRLLAALNDGRLPPGAKLASERELVAHYGVSRITIRQAMKELVLEGHLRSQPGKGFYATGRQTGAAYELELLRSFTATAIEHGQRPGSRLLHLAVEAAPETIARPLAITAGEPVVSLRRLRLLDDEPVAIAHDWIALKHVPDLARLDWSGGNRSLYAELRDRYNINPSRGQTILAARLADAEEAQLLHLSPPAAVLTVEQIAYDATNLPINLTFSTHHPERYPLQLEQEGLAGA